MKSSGLQFEEESRAAVSASINFEDKLYESGSFPALLTHKLGPETDYFFDDLLEIWSCHNFVKLPQVSSREVLKIFRSCNPVSKHQLGEVSVYCRDLLLKVGIIASIGLLTSLISTLSTIALAEGHLTVSIEKDGWKENVVVPDIISGDRYILEWSEESVLSKLKGSPSSLRPTEVTSQLNQLKSLRQRDLRDLRKLAPRIRVIEDSFLSINATFVQGPEDEVLKLRKFSRIKKVHWDSKFSIPDQTQVDSRQLPFDLSRERIFPPLEVPAIWEQFGVRGSRTTIAVIDTGIDYRHPDLGGCIGTNCKVIGGYDFIDSDGDPMDDNGHGTHVAGIAAANGLQQGVAPESRLLAYKVLAADGTGYESAIIRGIERALDPNQDGNLADAANVLNLSLGGPGDQGSALSIAANNAASISKVVVAAGNSGQTGIGAPATAVHSIAVAASDRDQMIAPFSSWGPGGGFHYKPDIAAPGVNISSTFLNGKYSALSGTSMAAPFISGLVALLDERHQRKLSTDETKAFLASHAKKLPYPEQSDDALLQSFFAQGQGLINPFAAFESVSEIGLNRYLDLSQNNTGVDIPIHLAVDPVVAVAQIIHIKCPEDAPTVVEASFEHNLGDKFFVDVSPTSASCVPGFPASFNLLVKGNTDQLKFETKHPFAQGVKLRVHTTDQRMTAEFPIALFVKSAINLTFPATDQLDLPRGVVISIRKPGFNSFTMPVYPDDDGFFRRTLFVDQGPHSIFLGSALNSFRRTADAFVLENFEVKQIQDIQIRASDLAHKVNLSVFAPDGSKYSSKPVMTSFEFPTYRGTSSALSLSAGIFSNSTKPVRTNAASQPEVNVTAKSYWNENQRSYVAVDMIPLGATKSVDFALGKNGYVGAKFNPVLGNNPYIYGCAEITIMSPTRPNKLLDVVTFMTYNTRNHAASVHVARSSLLGTTTWHQFFYHSVDPFLPASYSCLNHDSSAVSVQFGANEAKGFGYVGQYLYHELWFEMSDDFSLGSTYSIPMVHSMNYGKDYRVVIGSGVDSTGYRSFVPTSYRIARLDTAEVLAEGKTRGRGAATAVRFNRSSADFLIESAASHQHQSQPFDVNSTLMLKKLTDPARYLGVIDLGISQFTISRVEGCIHRISIVAISSQKHPELQVNQARLSVFDASQPLIQDLELKAEAFISANEQLFTRDICIESGGTSELGIIVRLQNANGDTFELKHPKAFAPID